MYLLGRAGGIKAQRALWRLMQTDRLLVADLSRPAIERSARLMDQRADRPMDLADTTLVAYAEQEGHREGHRDGRNQTLRKPRDGRRAVTQDLKVRAGAEVHSVDMLRRLVIDPGSCCRRVGPLAANAARVKEGLSDAIVVSCCACLR